MAKTLKHTILVVEDEPLLLRVIKRVLDKSSAYDVRCAVSAATGLRIGLDLSIPIHLLLANVMLNGTLGGELAAQVKKVRPAMGVILLAGEEDGELSVLDRGWQILDKQFISEELLVRIRAELKREDAGS